MARTPFIRPPFDPGAKTFVRRPFEAHGKRWSGGQRFDWEGMGVPPRRARQLYDAGYLQHPQPGHDPQGDFYDPNSYGRAEPAPAARQEKQRILDELNMRELWEMADAHGVPKRRTKADMVDELRKALA